jgi:hypothetical protein
MSKTRINFNLTYFNAFYLAVSENNRTFALGNKKTTVLTIKTVKNYGS